MAVTRNSPDFVEGTDDVPGHEEGLAELVKAGNEARPISGLDSGLLLHSTKSGWVPGGGGWAWGGQSFP